jgi:UDP-N-acetylmuramate: L-alanyl-gamma-D-glutamyl-meso-diaminopimelate ligase
VVTSIEFDHGDIYRDLSEIRKVFRDFVEHLAPSALLVAANEDPEVIELLSDCKATVETFGLERDSRFARASAHWSAQNIQEGPDGVSFDVFYQEKNQGRFHSPMLGRHNLRNLLGGLAVCRRYGILPQDAMGAMAGFRGVLRRQQVRARVNGVTIVDDFAHHPSAVRVTLEALRRGYPQGELWALFEPRSASSRRKIFQEQYVASFDAADHIVIAPVFKKDAILDEERFSTEQLIEDLIHRGKKAKTFSTLEEIISFVVKGIKPGDTLAILSNGGFGEIHDKIIGRLQDKG